MSTIILILIFCVGLSLLLYPAVSDYWNSLHQSRAIASYAEAVAEISNESYESIWEDAVAYNAALAERGGGWVQSAEALEEYNAQLNVNGTGVMSYIEIPSIKCSLPVYHGTDEAVMQIAVGHLEGSSLPVGGESTHCVLSGHRGLPSAKLFTDIDQLEAGDIFTLCTLDETLTYEVDRINIVLPNEVELLAIEEGEDLCTLITCTPYGVNSHRLLVRGHRVENQTVEPARVTTDAVRTEIPIAVLVIAVLVLLFIWLSVFNGWKKKR